MSKLYVYQIKGILEKSNKEIGGMRVLLCSTDFFDSVDIPADIFDRDTLRYLRYRLAVNDYLDINKLPIPILNKIRTPINQWLDHWVLMGIK